MPYQYSILEYFLFGGAKVNQIKLQKALEGKTILLTGASFGIGASLARLLSNCNCNLLLVARTASKLELLQKELKQKGKATIHIYPLDLTDKEGVARWLNQLPEKIDIVISNAGKSIKRPLMKSLERLHDFERTMALNYRAPVQILLAIIPKLAITKGQIINVSALNVLLLPAPHWAAYQASKAAFDQWFRAAQAELNAIGIATSSLYLPLVRTRMIAPTKAYDNMPAMHPLHVAHLVTRLILSRKNHYQTWWLPFAKLGSLLFRSFWEWGTTIWVKRSS